MMKRVTIKVLAILMCLVLLIFQLTAFAAADDKTGSISISFSHEDEYIGGVEFELYHVADNDWNMIAPFDKYPIQFAALSQDELGSAASTLATYIARDGIEALKTEATDPYGRAVFDNLPLGIYLIVGAAHIDGTNLYRPQPFFAALPSLDTDGDLQYDFTAEPKYDMWDTEDKLERSVEKVWEDKDFEDARPTSIVVQLLENGKVVEEVELNEGNDWSYKWRGLSGASVWQVVEKEVPDGFAVVVTQEGSVYTITNTRVSPPDEEPPSDPPQDPDGPEDPENPDNPDNPKNPENPKDPSLPQTGQLWWPVFILLAVGAVMLAVGIVFNKRRSR